MRRVLLLLCALLLPLMAVTTYRLYLKDGDHHRVSEHKVENGRVKYFSVERNEWEEIPAEMVDLAKTEKERGEREQLATKIERAEREERKLEKQERSELYALPNEPGLFRVEEGRAIVMEAGELKTTKDRGRQAMKVVLPVPIVSGRAKIELVGAKAKVELTDREPEFFIRQEVPMPYTLVKAVPGKNTRLVDTWKVEPMTGIILEHVWQEVKVFRRQLDEGVVKFWPLTPLEPGEYAIVQYTDENPDMRVWDFSIK